MPSVPFITPANAQQLAAKSHEARRAKIVMLEQTVQTLVQAPADKLQARARELDALASQLKAQLRGTKDPQDALRLAQAIDKLEQSWARYAGIPMPPKARPMSRRPPPTATPLD